MRPREKHNEILADCFAELCSRLSGLVARSGGEKTRKQFENTINARAAALGKRIAVNESRVFNQDDGSDWTRYRELTRDMIDHARTVAGDKRARTVRQVMRELESRAGTNLYEISYRLGVLEHVKDG